MRLSGQGTPPPAIGAVDFEKWKAAGPGAWSRSLRAAQLPELVPDGFGRVESSRTPTDRAPLKMHIGQRTTHRVAAPRGRGQGVVSKTLSGGPLPGEKKGAGQFDAAEILPGRSTCRSPRARGRRRSAAKGRCSTHGFEGWVKKNLEAVLREAGKAGRAENWDSPPVHAACRKLDPGDRVFPTRFRGGTLPSS